MLSVHNLSYTFGDKPILRNLSFKIEKGDFVGLLGPNGSGKTTLLKIFSGSLRKYEGSANLNVLHIKHLKPKGLAQTVAIVPQSTTFPFPYSALEVVLMGRHPHKKGFGFDSPDDLSIAEMAMKKTDSWQFAKRTIDSLSGGEKQRVLLARALAQKPKILLLDEPSTHLDIKHQVEFFHLLKELNQNENMTIVCVVHDINLAAHFFTKMIFLKNGECVVQGPTSEVLTEQTIQNVFDIKMTKGQEFVPFIDMN